MNTSAQVGIKVPSVKVAVAATLHFGLEAQCRVFLIDGAHILAFILCQEPVAVAQTPTVDEGRASLLANVEIPLVVSALTRAHILLKKTDLRTRRVHAMGVALKLVFEMVQAGVAASVPEPTAASVFGVVEPHGRVVATRTCLGG